MGNTIRNGAILSGDDLGDGYIGSLQMVQATTVAAAPVSGARVFTLPAGALVSDFWGASRSAFTVEARLRFSTVSTGDENLGFVLVSSQGRYQMASLATEIPALQFGAASAATPVYATLHPVSGDIAGLAGNFVASVRYSPRPVDGPSKTRYRGAIRSGVDTGVPATTTIGYGRLSQSTTVAATPVSGQQIGILPHGARLDDVNVYVRTAASGDATIRLSTTSDANSNNLGTVTLSGAGKYSVMQGTALTTFSFGLNTSGSAQPIYATILAASGEITALGNSTLVEIVYTRLDNVAPGITTPKTTFSGPVGHRADDGSMPSGLVVTGWGVFSQQTTVAAAPASAQLVAVLPKGAMLLRADVVTREAATGEVRGRFTIGNNTTLASDALGATGAISAAGRWSAMNAAATAAVTLPWGINNTGSSVPIYFNFVSLSGSIGPLAGDVYTDVVYARLDARVYGE